MRTRAERRASFEREAATGMRRYKANDSLWWRQRADEPDYIKRDRYRKKRCSCDMCKPGAYGIKHISVRRFMADDGGLGDDA